MTFSTKRMGKMKNASVFTLLMFLLVIHNVKADGTGIVEDDFNDEIIDTVFWTPFKCGPMSVTEMDGFLKVSTSEGHPGGTGGLRSRVQLVGDCDVWIDYNWASYDGLRHARFGLLLCNANETERVYLNCHRWSLGSSHEIILTHYKDGRFRNVKWIIGGSVPLSGKLRICRQGTTFYGYYWSSNDWKLLGSIDAFSTAGHVTINANNYESSSTNLSLFPAFEVHWDNFHVEADQIIYEPVLMVEATVDLNPDVFEVTVDPNAEWNQSQEAFLRAYIELPADVNVGNIDSNTVTLSLNGNMLASAEVPVIVDNVIEILFCLEPSSVSTILGSEVVTIEAEDEKIGVAVTTMPSQAIDLVQLSVFGALGDGRIFTGTDAVRVILKQE